MLVTRYYDRSIEGKCTQSIRCQKEGGALPALIASPELKDKGKVVASDSILTLLSFSLWDPSSFCPPHLARGRKM